MKLAVACLLVTALACADTTPATQRYALQLRAQLPNGEPLAGVRFWLTGREAGPTGDDGRASTTLSGRDGDAVQITTLCPPGHTSPSEPRTLRLQRIAPVAAKDTAALSVSVRCEPERAAAALIVRAHGPAGALALPIVVDGRVVGQTDQDGVAHVLLHSAPRSSLQVRLDTSHDAKLVPRDPVRVFDLEDTESILLFDQAFSVAHAAAKETRKHVVQPPHLRVPYRIQ